MFEQLALGLQFLESFGQFSCRHIGAPQVEFGLASVEGAVPDQHQPKWFHRGGSRIQRGQQPIPIGLVARRFRSDPHAIGVGLPRGGLPTLGPAVEGLGVLAFPGCTDDDHHGLPLSGGRPGDGEGQQAGTHVRVTP